MLYQTVTSDDVCWGKGNVESSIKVSTTCVVLSCLLPQFVYYFVESNRDSSVRKASLEKHISLKEAKPLNLMVLIRKMKLSTFL